MPGGNPFQAHPPNLPARIAAGLIVAAFGLGFALQPFLLHRAFGLALLAAGAGAAVYYGSFALRERARRDPYDLSRLWDEPPPEPEEPEDDGEVRELVYCHRCGAAAPEQYAVCPECGNRLGR